MSVYNANDMVLGIKAHDLWRWIAALNAIGAALRDDGKEQMAQGVYSMAEEFGVIVCPEDDCEKG